MTLPHFSGTIWAPIWRYILMGMCHVYMSQIHSDMIWDDPLVPWWAWWSTNADHPQYGLVYRISCQHTCVWRGNINAAWFDRFWQFAHQIDVQHTVDMAGACDTYVICQLEFPFKGTRRDATMQIGFLLILFGFLTRDDQCVFAHLNR